MLEGVLEGACSARRVVGMGGVLALEGGGFQRWKGGSRARRGVPAGLPTWVPALEGCSSTHFKGFNLQCMIGSFIYHLPFVLRPHWTSSRCCLWWTGAAGSLGAPKSSDFAKGSGSEAQGCDARHWWGSGHPGDKVGGNRGFESRGLDPEFVSEGED